MDLYWFATYQQILCQNQRIYLVIFQKLGQGHQNLVSSLLCHNDTIYNVLPESLTFFLSRDNVQERDSGQNLTFQCACVTLEIRSISPKSN